MMSVFLNKKHSNNVLLRGNLQWQDEKKHLEGTHEVSSKAYDTGARTNYFPLLDMNLQQQKLHLSPLRSNGIPVARARNDLSSRLHLKPMLLKCILLGAICLNG